jgi:Phasin protein
MAKDKEPFESLTTTAELITEPTMQAMENYVSWLQSAMSTFPWVDTDLNKKLMSHATENVTATFAFLRKLSQAKTFEDVTKTQMEFMSEQFLSFNEQTIIIREIYTKMATMERPF